MGFEWRNGIYASTEEHNSVAFENFRMFMALASGALVGYLFVVNLLSGLTAQIIVGCLIGFFTAILVYALFYIILFLVIALAVFFAIVFVAINYG